MFGSILLLCVEERFGLAENKSNSFWGVIQILNKKRLLADFVNSSCTFLSAVDVNWEKQICSFYQPSGSSVSPSCFCKKRNTESNQ